MRRCQQRGNSPKHYRKPEQGISCQPREEKRKSKGVSNNGDNCNSLHRARQDALHTLAPLVLPIVMNDKSQSIKYYCSPMKPVCKQAGDLLASCNQPMADGGLESRHSDFKSYTLSQYTTFPPKQVIQSGREKYRSFYKKGIITFKRLVSELEGICHIKRK